MWDVQDVQLTNTNYKPTKKRKHDPDSYADYVNQYVEDKEELSEIRYDNKLPEGY